MTCDRLKSEFSAGGGSQSAARGGRAGSHMHAVCDNTLININVHEVIFMLQRWKCCFSLSVTEPLDDHIRRSPQLLAH